MFYSLYLSLTFSHKIVKYSWIQSAYYSLSPKGSSSNFYLAKFSSLKTWLNQYLLEWVRYRRFLQRLSWTLTFWIFNFLWESRMNNLFLQFLIMAFLSIEERLLARSRLDSEDHAYDILYLHLSLSTVVSWAVFDT